MPVIIRELIVVGANLKLCDSRGNNIVHLAAEYGYNSSLLEVIRSCKSSKMQELFEIYQELLDSRNCEGREKYYYNIVCACDQLIMINLLSPTIIRSWEITHVFCVIYPHGK